MTDINAAEETINHIAYTLEVLLINQLRQTDLLMAIAMGMDQEQVLQIINIHKEGRIVGDIPFMVSKGPEDSTT